jgi:hypothetical protein
MQLDKDEVSLILSALEWDRVGTYGDGRGEKIDALMAKIKRQEGARVQELSRCGHSDADNAQTKCVSCGLNVGACCGVCDDFLAWCGVCWGEKEGARV